MCIEHPLSVFKINMIIWMFLEPKHKNFKDEYKIKERVRKKIYIRRHMSVLVALEWHYFQELLNWWHSPFKLLNLPPLGDCRPSALFAEIQSLLPCDTNMLFNATFPRRLFCTMLCVQHGLTEVNYYLVSYPLLQISYKQTAPLPFAAVTPNAAVEASTAASAPPSFSAVQPHT